MIPPIVSDRKSIYFLYTESDRKNNDQKFQKFQNITQDFCILSQLTDKVSVKSQYDKTLQYEVEIEESIFHIKARCNKKFESKFKKLIAASFILIFLNFLIDVLDSFLSASCK